MDALLLVVKLVTIDLVSLQALRTFPKLHDNGVLKLLVVMCTIIL